MQKLIQFTKTELQKRRQFIIYSIIGVSGATLDFIIFLILFNKFHINKNFATAISTTFGITNNFFWNIKFNFKVKDNLKKRFLSFYSIGIVGLFMTFAIFFIFVDKLHFNTNLIKLFSIVFVVIAQYSLNKRISFKN